MLLILILICPLVAAVLSLFLRKTKLEEIISLSFSFIEFAIGLYIIRQIIKFGEYTTKYFRVDSLGAFALFITTTICLLSLTYAVGYFREEVKKGIIGPTRVRQFFVLIHLFTFAMLFALSTTNPILMWIAIEITTLSTAFLISFYNQPKALEAAWKYLIINSVGLLLGFFGTLLFFTATKDSNSFVTWQTLAANAANLNPVLAKVAFVFMFIGYGTKVGFVPMHTWKPDAYSRAPAPLGALFSGPVLCIAFLAILRYKSIADLALTPKFTSDIFIFFGILTLILSAFIIFTQKNFKRLFAYSSIEHAGIMALGFGFGGAGTYAALLHMLYHSLAKPTVFFSSGNILLKYGSVKIPKIKGALHALPFTIPLMLAGILALVGIPPFGMFITEFNILSAGSANHLAITVAALAALAIIFAGFLRHISNSIFGNVPQDIQKGEFNILTTLPLLISIALLLIFSFYLPTPLLTILNSAAALIK